MLSRKTFIAVALPCAALALVVAVWLRRPHELRKEAALPRSTPAPVVTAVAPTIPQEEAAAPVATAPIERVGQLAE